MFIVPVIHSHLLYYSFKSDYHVIDAHFYLIPLDIHHHEKKKTTTTTKKTQKNRKIITTALSISFDRPDQPNSDSPSLDVCLPAAIKMTSHREDSIVSSNNVSSVSNGVSDISI